MDTKLEAPFVALSVIPISGRPAACAISCILWMSDRSSCCCRLSGCSLNGNFSCRPQLVVMATALLSVHCRPHQKGVKFDISYDNRMLVTPPSTALSHTLSLYLSISLLLGIVFNLIWVCFLHYELAFITCRMRTYFSSTVLCRFAYCPTQVAFGQLNTRLQRLPQVVPGLLQWAVFCLAAAKAQLTSAP